MGSDGVTSHGLSPPCMREQTLSRVLLLLGMATVSCAIRTVELQGGALVGFKAAPGTDCCRLFAHAKATQGHDQGESPTPDWSGIYVQLDMEQAVNYVPNQFDRGESTVSVVALRVRENQCLRICVCEDERMADASISSKAKAELVRNQVSSSSDLLAHDPAVPLLAAFGQKGLALSSWTQKILRSLSPTPYLARLSSMPKRCSNSRRARGYPAQSGALWVKAQLHRRCRTW